MQTEQTPQDTKNHLLSPYHYNSDMLEEQFEDEALDYIQDLCLAYLKDDLEMFKALYIPSDITDSYKFVQLQLKKLRHKQKVLGLNDNTDIFTCIGHSMDLMTAADKISNFNNNTIYYELTTQLNLGLKILEFCEAILAKIIYTRKER